MRKIIASTLILIFFFNNVFAKEIKPKKDESDAILNAVTNAVKQAVSLPGLQNAKKVGVLVVRSPLAEPILSPTIKGKIDLLDYIPIINLFRKKQYTVYSAVKVPEGETVMSHTPLIEDQIVNELLSLGRFELIETIPNFYGNLQQLMIDGQQLEKIIEDPSKIANIGKLLGVDTMIVGSAAGSMMKYVIRENFFYIKNYFIVNVKLNLRTVDVLTGKITSSTLATGKDSVLISSFLKPEPIILGLLIIFTIFSSGGGNSE